MAVLDDDAQAADFEAIQDGDSKPDVTVRWSDGIRWDDVKFTWEETGIMSTSTSSASRIAAAKAMLFLGLCYSSAWFVVVKLL